MWQEPVWDGARCALDELSILVIKTCRWRSVGRWVDGWQEGPLNGSTCELNVLPIGSARWMVGKQRGPQSWFETGRNRYIQGSAGGTCKGGYSAICVAAL